MKIRAVLFDYDGVLTTDRTGTLTTSRYLSEKTGIGRERIEAVFARYNADLLVGKTSHREIWPEICRELRCEPAIEILTEAFRSTPENAGMFTLVQRLKTRYRLGIITDNKKDRIDCLRRFQNLDAVFDPIVVSAEIGHRKTGPEIFSLTLKYLRLRPEECVFIDNQPKNLEIPRQMGMKTVFHDDEKNDVRELERVLRHELVMEF